MLTGEIITRKEFWLQSGCHPKDSLIIVLEGSFRCRIAEKCYQANPHDIFVFHANTYFERAVLLPITCIYLQLDTFPSVLEDGIMPIQDQTRKSNTILYLKQAIREQNLVLAQHFVDDIFIMQQQGQCKQQICMDDIVSTCIDFFTKNYGTEINLDTLTNEFHISKQWLITKFKKHTEKTPMEYLQGIRLHYGKKLLANTNVSVGDIAAACGFENLYYFSNTFKRCIGLSPTQYRKSFQL